MLERVLRLFPIESFCADVRAVMSDYILRIFEKHPSLVVDLKKDLLDFISDRNNVGEGREEVRKSKSGLGWVGRGPRQRGQRLPKEATFEITAQLSEAVLHKILHVFLPFSFLSMSSGLWANMRPRRWTRAATPPSWCSIMKCLRSLHMR
jgi:hypothetical protein